MTKPELTVRHVMDHDPVAVTPDTKVQEVLRLMNQRRIGSVLVVEGDRLLGIFTERDLLIRVHSAVPGWRDYPVRDWMTANPYTVSPDVGWDEAVGMMQKFRIRHLPVVKKEKVIGIVSTRLLMARRAEYLNRKVEARTAELRQANEQLMARDAEILHNLRAAGRLQMKLLLPHAPPPWPELKYAVHYVPLDHLGGDYYDFALPTPDHLGFLIADASGHSISSALVAVMTRFAFMEASAGRIHPGEVLTEMNRRLQELTEELFVTAFYGVFERRTGIFRYATAGHPPPLVYLSRTKQVRPLHGEGFLLGVMPDEIYAEREAVLDPGDKICFYTDGLLEARNEIGEMFGFERLKHCLKNHGHSPAQEIMGEVLNCQKGFCRETKPADDVTMVFAEIQAPNWDGIRIGTDE